MCTKRSTEIGIKSDKIINKNVQNNNIYPFPLSDDDAVADILYMCRKT